MQIKQIFEKDLFRPINGVIKVGDESAESVWQEVDEYVVTKELGEHFLKFFNNYLEAIDNPRNTDVRNRNGIWVSGFFGSGKSHFIKIISHLLRNDLVTNPATKEARHPIDFFENKIHDKLFLSDIKRAVANPVDVLLFNIDSKAGNNDGRDAILRVFMRVFNEMQGFSPQHPHLAEIELQLEKEGKYETFQSAFQRIFGKPWKEERNNYRFRREATVSALTEATGMTTDAAEKLLEETRADYNLTVESFANRVKEYLDRRGKNHRIIFVADEVGQFIGTDTHLMLNLQTIVEELGKICKGKAWVVVTSQEDMDAVLGNVVGAKSNDFSKIQGRFPTRLSLSSSNTDEVIQARLLEKNSESKSGLNELFKEKGDVLKNQLSFIDGATLKNFKDADDFTKNYPFAPYHYKLVQSVFESIRKAGATGLHLARGERSMLDAFQIGAKSIADFPVGALVPFYAFYPSVESFLDTAVKRTIDQASDNESLHPFDTQVLRLLFLIRYVDVIKSKVENLVTLCIKTVDDDRIALKKQIEESLARLEKQTLISRNGDLFYFLTNEERDIGREIKSIDVTSDETMRHLSKILFDEILMDAARFRYPVNKKDFPFNRLTDGRPFQGNLEHSLNLEVITPLNDDYEKFTTQNCILGSDGKILIRLPDHKGLSGELRTYLQTQRYVQQKNDAAAAPATRRILSDRAMENQQRGQRIAELLQNLLNEADTYVTGQKLSAERKISIPEAQNYLIKNLFNKLGYLDAPANDPIEEMRAVLLADDLGQQTLNLDSGQPNANAHNEIRNYIKLRTNNQMRATLEEVTQYFERRPFGWRDTDTALLVAKLFAAGELKAIIEGASVNPRAAVESFTKPGRWKLVSISERPVIGQAELTKARTLAHEVFGKLSPETGEDALAKFIKGLIAERQEKLREYRAVAETGEYPGSTEINKAFELAQDQLNTADTSEFLRSFNDHREDWLETGDDFVKIEDFYTNQIDIWRKLRSKVSNSFKDNRTLLEQNPDARNALLRMEQILIAPEPYGMIRDIDNLIAMVDSVNQQIITGRRAQAVLSIEMRIAQVKSGLDSINAAPDFRHNTLYPFQQTKAAIEQEESVPRIAYQEGEHADNLFHQALEKIETEGAKNDSGNTVGLTAPPPTRIIKPATLLSPKTYIETREDLEEYINKVRAEMERILGENERIRLQ